MNLKVYFNILQKRLWVIILLPLMAVVVSAILSFFIIKPVYEASTTLYVVNKDFNPQSPSVYEDVMAGQMLVKDYKELVKSRTVTEAVIAKLNIVGLDPSELSEKINVDLKNDTRVLEITVYYKSAAGAVELADTVAEIFMEKVIELMKTDDVSVIDTAAMPEEPFKPKPLINISVSLIAGMLAAVSIALLLEFMNDTIANSEDVEKYMGLGVIGVIPSLDIK